MTIPVHYTFHTDPDPVQREFFELSKDAVNFAAFMDPGVGKSKPTIDTGVYLYEQRLIDAMLVVADNGVHQNWSEVELLKHLPPRVQAVPVAYVAGRSLNKFYAQLSDACRTFPILCVSHDTLTTATGKTVLTNFLRQRRVLMVLDESQRYKTPSAKRTRAVWGYSKLATYRRILTGSSVTKGYEDLYAQFRFLDPAIIGCNSFAEFKAEFCLVRQWDGYSTIEGYRNTEELFRRLRPYMYVAKLVLDAPDPEWYECKVPLTPDQQKAYRELRDEYLTELGPGDIVSSALTITRILRMSQITSGHTHTDDGRLVTVPSHRPEAVRRIMRKHPGEKFLVWCAYQEDVTLLMKELAEFNPCRFDGAIPHKQAMEQKALWQSDPERRVLILTMAKGGRGYTLIEGRVAIYYSYTEDYEHWFQSKARNFRRGVTWQVLYYVLVAPGTQDRKMIRTVNRKDGMAMVMKNPRVFQGWLENPDAVDGPSGITFNGSMMLTIDPTKG